MNYFQLYKSRAMMFVALALARNRYICELADRLFFIGVTEQSSLFPLKEEFNAKTWIDNHISIVIK